MNMGCSDWEEHERSSLFGELSLLDMFLLSICCLRFGPAGRISGRGSSCLLPINCCIQMGLKDYTKGFGISIVTYSPSNAIWWASYTFTRRVDWGGVGWYSSNKHITGVNNLVTPDTKTIMALKGMSVAMDGGISALITMYLDTINTRLQFLDDYENGRKGRQLDKQ